MSNDLTLNADTIQTIKSIIEADTRIKVSLVSVTTLVKPSLCVKIFYNTKEECTSGILMNGPHRFIMLHANGEMVNLTGYKTAKFRQGKVKSVQEFATKFQKYLTTALEVA